jgi:hypothetical protein
MTGSRWVFRRIMIISGGGVILAGGGSAGVGWWFSPGCGVFDSGTAALLAGRDFRPVTEPVLPIRTST